MAAELEQDIAELQRLKTMANRGNVRVCLEEILGQWKVKYESLKTQEKSEKAANSTVRMQSGNAIRPLKALNTYAYDESDKFIKLYYTVPGCTPDLSKENLMANFGADSFHIRCINVKGADFEINMKGLLHPIDLDNSTVKPKTDSLLVMLRKKKDGEKWGALLKLEAKTKEAKLPKFDDKGDPQESLMQMMKQMYDEGDDEMKRTMRKAWHEGQQKKEAGGLGMMEDL